MKIDTFIYWLMVIEYSDLMIFEDYLENPERYPHRLGDLEKSYKMRKSNDHYLPNSEQIALKEALIEYDLAKEPLPSDFVSEYTMARRSRVSG